MTPDSHLTPPIVDSKSEPLAKGRSNPDGSAVDDVTIPVKALSAAEAAAGLQATVDDLRGQLEREINNRERANKAISRIRGDLEGAERILRATQPRARTPKRPNTGKPG
jgi:hypothetical protein